MKGLRPWGALRRLPALLRDAAAFVFLPAIVLVVAVDVVARYFLNLPLQWSQEVASLALLLVFVAAIPYANASNAHIRTETLYERYSPRMQALVDLLSALCGGVLMGVIAWWQLRELPGLIHRNSSNDWGTCAMDKYSSTLCNAWNSICISHRNNSKFCITFRYGGCPISNR